MQPWSASTCWMQSKPLLALRSSINICLLGSSSHGARRIRPHRNSSLRFRISQILVVVVFLVLLLGCNSWVEEGRCVYLYRTGIARSACAFGWRDQQRGQSTAEEGGAWRRSEVCGGGGCYRASCSAWHCPQNSCAMVGLSLPLPVCHFLSVSRVLGFGLLIPLLGGGILFDMWNSVSLEFSVNQFPMWVPTNYARMF